MDYLKVKSNWSLKMKMVLYYNLYKSLSIYLKVDQLHTNSKKEIDI